MNINWKEIKEKYPKSWELFKNEYNPILEDMNNAVAYNPESTEFCRKKEDIINSIFYAITEKFFDERGIIIDVIICYSALKAKSTRFNIYDKNTYELLYNVLYIGEKKDYTKEQAIIKAFEILENKLKEE